MLSYREIRRDYQAHFTLEPVLSDYYAKLWSPLFTQMSVALQLTPNTVTLLMMLSGVLGAGLFALPFLACKAGGTALIHLWYVLDCSDGEVARITRQFSKFGKELDYMAHVLNHPLFNLAFTFSVLGLKRYEPQTVLLVGILSISAELAIRNILGFQHVFALKMGAGPGEGPKGPLRLLAMHASSALSTYSNLAMLFPVLFLVDAWRGTSLAFPYLVLHTGVSILMAAYMGIRWTRAAVRL